MCYFGTAERKEVPFRWACSELLKSSTFCPVAIFVAACCGEGLSSH